MDRFPWDWFIPRLVDLGLYLLALLTVVATFIYPSLKTETYGLLLLIIGLYSEYRQSTHYSMNHIENSLISNGLSHTPVHQIAKLRAQLAKLNIVIIIAGSILTCWGVFR